MTAPREAPDVEKLLRAVATAGAPAPSPAERLIFEFPSSGKSSQGNAAATAPWMLGVLLRLQQDDDLQRAGRRAESDPSMREVAATGDSVWTVVARDGQGLPIVSAAASGQQMVVRVGVSGIEPPGRDGRSFHARRSTGIDRATRARDLAHPTGGAHRLVEAARRRRTGRVAARRALGRPMALARRACATADRTMASFAAVGRSG